MSIVDDSVGVSVGGVGDLAEDMIAQRIKHTLSIFPKLSPSMLQIGVGTGFPPALWHPVLERLIALGEVTRTQEAVIHPVSNRQQTYTILSLSAGVGG